jgi:hypothetical protein
VTPAWLVLAFFCTCALLVGLPLWPAWREWGHPTDLRALAVPQRYSSEASHFAQQLRGDDVALAEAGMRLAALRKPDGARPLDAAQPLYAADDTVLPGGSTVDAILCARHLRIGAGGRVVSWAHADLSMEVAGPSVCLTRLSAGTTLLLDAGCCFERLHAPHIRFGPEPEARLPAVEAFGTASYDDMPGARRRSAVLHRIDGDCRLEDAKHYAGCLVVAGRLELGAGTVVDGDLKAHGGIRLGPMSRVNGSVIARGPVEFGAGAFAAGPVSSESEVHLAAAARIGSLQAPTTISASVVAAETGAATHGTVWAREAGVVWAAA